MIKIEDFFAPDSFRRMKACADNHETPFVLIDLDTISRSYDELIQAFPFSTVYFAVKANPDIDITRLLVKKGSSFDIASIYELDKVMSAGLPAERISYGNTIKKAAHIKYFYEKGVRLFATDCETDLLNIARYAPGSKVYARVLVDDISPLADWPLSKKFGCHLSMARKLLTQALSLGLCPYGVSFHVGSQQRDTEAWNSVLGAVSELYKEFKDVLGHKLEMVNLGGGLPANYVVNTAPLYAYSQKITSALDTFFPGDLRPSKIIMEPGRSLVGNSGVLVTEVVMTSRKGGKTLNDVDCEVKAAPGEVLPAEQRLQAGEKWVYLDCGKFGGMAETADECIKYPIVVEAVAQRDTALMQAAASPAATPVTPVMALCTHLHPYPAQASPIDVTSSAHMLKTAAVLPHCASLASTHVPSELSLDILPALAAPVVPSPVEQAAVEFATREREDVIIAGPTCDSADILYEHTKYKIPVGVQQGDRFFFVSAGAYTTSYSSVEFNGFPPLKTIILQNEPECHKAMDASPLSLLAAAKERPLSEPATPATVPTPTSMSFVGGAHLSEIIHA